MVVAIELRPSQQAVLTVIEKLGPLTDSRISKEYVHAVYFDGAPPQSPSGLRTRRCELVDLGLVVDSGEFFTLKSGRKSVAWKAA